MWQNKTQKLRAIAEAKKRERDYSRLHIHFKRIAASIRVLPLDTPPGLTPEILNNENLTPIEVRAVLNDLNKDGVGLYSQESLNPGQEIILSFEKPHSLVVRAQVRWCEKHNANSHIISAQSFSYRIGVEFIINNPEEEKSIVAFCNEMIKTYLGPPTD